jgi:hypothetical protein
MLVNLTLGLPGGLHFVVMASLRILIPVFFRE